MKRNRVTISLLSVISLFSFSIVTNALNKDSKLGLISQATEDTNTLTIGYLPDAEPVSYTQLKSHNRKSIGGYCRLLKEYLENEYNIKINVIEISYDERFKRIEGIDIECGPNSITKDRDEDLKAFKGKFSIGFFDTYTTLLIDRNKIDNFKTNSPLKEIRIGILTNTTNEEKIRVVYPNAEFIKIKNRGDAIEKLQDGTIDAFANDEILLKDIKKEFDKKRIMGSQYSIFPQNDVGFGFETYGVVVYDDAILWTNINNWIKGNNGQAAVNQALRY